MTVMTNTSKPMEPCVKMALEIEKVFDPHGDSPIGTDQFNAICDVCEKWLCLPAPETQAVATVSKASGAFRLEWCGDFKNLQDGDKLYRSPVESAPALAPFEKLVEEMRDMETESSTYWADRLSAVVEEVRGK